MRDGDIIRCVSGQELGLTVGLDYVAFEVCEENGRVYVHNDWGELTSYPQEAFVINN